ncbi:cell surface A33 antigen-like isoform X1 [Phyllopteryx taeniolatus]|uniref:cell surface A33 antigen-like isoform X1 n=2 Tax=Phyllopteryx taeniolatus TaxID=161469 RepID=UPI002AD3BF5F|nr:cell surface A33 antigen-like isoform X1 [Phyllopteryx taeniolatus]
MEMRIFTFTLLYLMVIGAGALQVSIAEDQYEYARGDNVTLPCLFQSTVTRPPVMVILWSVEGLEANADEKVIAAYYFPGALTDIKEAYKKRVSMDVDLAAGKADLKLTSISLADNKEFECRVQIPGDTEGTLFDTARLVVLVAPSTPTCKIEGKEEYGQNINLTCISEEGSPPPKYEWTSLDVRNVPHIKDRRTTSKGGVLSLFNITKDTSGYYTCTSSNKIRSASCNITLTVMPPSMNVGFTAGIIAGVVAALIILVVVIYCCCCRKKKEKEEYAMGVREEGHPDKVPDKNGAERSAVRRDEDDSDVRAPLRDQYEERRERDHSPRSDYDDRHGDPDNRRRDPDDRRSDYDDRRSDYDDRRSDYDDRRSDYDDRRRDYDDRRRDYDDRRSDYDDRRSDYSNVRDEYSRERYDDNRRTDPRDKYSDRRDHYDDDNEQNGDKRNHDDDRYDEPYDDRERPPVPSDKPRRRDN